MNNRLYESKKIFAKQLSELMVSKNLNQQQLSDELKIPRQTISNWLHLKRSPQMDSLEMIANYFNVSIDYLFDRDKNNI